MRRGYLIAVLLCAAEALALAVVLPARAEDQGAQTLSPPSLTPTLQPPTPAPTQGQEPAAAEPVSPSPEPATPQAVPQDQPPLAAGAPADPVVSIIRSKLTDPALRKGANPDDLAALEALDGARGGGPLWMTDMGFSARGQAAIFEIGKADDWGLQASSFELPDAGALPGSKEEEALAELKLDLAILKYARFARGSRFDPSTISELFDQVPPLRDPRVVLAEIEAAPSPDLYLQSLQPKHEQFARLRQALLKAREEGTIGGKPASDRDIKKIVINMERWRWMPEDLGPLYVWNNSPEFMVYLVKDGKPIYADKILVGTLAYATPVFTADMKTIVFNPDWNAPETVVKENLLPPLRDGNLSILKVHKLSVSLNGTPVDPARVDWGRVNILAYNFSQKAGPENVLGKVKFLFPNKHTVYMHDTLAYRKKFFQKPMRAIGHECVRMEKPQSFAEVLLAQDQGLSSSQVKELWDNAVNKPVSIEHKVPVHMVYFTAVVDDAGKVSSFADLYGLDNKMATALFGSAAGFPMPPPESRLSEEEAEAEASTPSASRQSRTAASHNDIAGSLGFIGD
jgi:murein L,D-transpeptidase YcbB/YkuD